MDALESDSKIIDAYYDGLLYDGMSPKDAMWVEDQRSQAHRRLAGRAVSAALSEPEMRTAFDREDDPIKRVR